MLLKRMRVDLYATKAGSLNRDYGHFRFSRNQHDMSFNLSLFNFCQNTSFNRVQSKSTDMIKAHPYSKFDRSTTRIQAQ